MKCYSYCALHKFKSADEAFRFMSGDYWIDGKGSFCILDDDTFPRFILGHAILVIYSYMQGDLTENDCKETIKLDTDGTVTTGLLDEPFLLWSKRLGAFYGYHYDTEEIGDVTDEEFAENYKELIKAYDLEKIIQKALLVAHQNKTAFMGNEKEMARLLKRYGLTMRKLKNFGEDD